MEMLRTGYDDACARWPKIALAWERFLGHAESHCFCDLELTADLFLACACADGDREAQAVLDRELLSPVPKWVASIDRTHEFGEEVRQLLRIKLLGEGGAIGDYAGRAPLQAWLHVAALRTALNLRRGARPTVDVDSSELERLLPTSDPEMRLLKDRSRELLAVAFRASLAELSTADRQLLKLHFLDQLTFMQIGRLEGVAKSTVSRRLADIRGRLLEETRRRLRDSLGLDEAELKSLMRAAGSELDLSFESYLR
jgi:RNA polymerase sigma-70 factor (ECF subfamily)